MENAAAPVRGGRPVDADREGPRLLLATARRDDDDEDGPHREGTSRVGDRGLSRVRDLDIDVDHGAPLPQYGAELRITRLFLSATRSRVAKERAGEDMDETSAAAALGEHDRIVFHGTSDAFDAFDLGRCGRGGDANSHLGVHLAEEAREAAEYAEAAAARRGGEAQVLVVRAVAANPFAGFDYHAFFGYGHDGGSVIGPEEFARRRLELIAQGYDSVDYQDGEQTICVSLDPTLLGIVAVLTPAEAAEVGERIEALPDPDDDRARLGIVAHTVAARSTTPRAV